MESKNKKLQVIQVNDNVVLGMTCFAAQGYYNVSCQRNNCQYWFSNSDNNNCVLIATQNGPHTLQKIGEMYGLTRMRICQIEKNILDKIRKII